jgi:hypothetical protein
MRSRDFIIGPSGPKIQREKAAKVNSSNRVNLGAGSVLFAATLH